jgi:hypothetical protein
MGRMLREFPDAALRLREALADDLAATAADLGRVRARLLAIGGDG